MTYTITDLANEFGITHRALRFYEEKGLIEPARKGQTRIYSDRDRTRLRLIINGRDVGLTLYEIRQILDSYRKDDVTEQNRIAVEFFRRRLAAVKEQRARVDDQIDRLEEACERLAGEDIEASAPRRGSRSRQAELRTGTH
ncbi:MerR family transcriptional regulator [Parvibaculum sp.]|uniref:MerR family transcriptional regulator n=1 Tax=Parvibaculum sp. TaxID=2024848 RepID=UPI001B2E9BEB|nr:MerR family transcriptional regulator [Parvibaculum sp.]MBO6633546.1 MerR family transcriptional regulator [Parvibaculum sp.]MBO6677694.1 MerR family transcriptional regulator [Parvibaculum sp.]MBO6685382.1 MerR family transcriptional regulator [Parvibaculum sp.]MBO6905455.1 MerR family transcriptional regulator [Parvibaculum sp.]